MDIDDTDTRPDSDDEEFRLETAHQVFQDLWGDFYEWEQSFCSQTISSLSRSGHFTAFDPPAEPTTDPIPADDFGEWFSITDGDHVASTRTHTDVCSKTVIVEHKGFRAYSRYTSCTPASLNVSSLEHLLHSASFLPFSDNPEFNTDEYLDEFRTFGWQADFFDPDR